MHTFDPKKDPYLVFGLGSYGFMLFIKCLVVVMSIMSVVGFIQMWLMNGISLCHFSKNGPICTHTSVHDLLGTNITCEGEDIIDRIVSFGFIDEYSHLVKNDVSNFCYLDPQRLTFKTN